MDEMSHELRLIDLSKLYGSKKALDSVNAQFSTGIYGVLGSNGAGKTTLMNLIADNLKRTSGKILFDGVDVLSMGRQFRRRLGYVPQCQSFYESMTVNSFLYYIAELKSVPKREAVEQINSLSELLNLDLYRRKQLSVLSVGIRQRILLLQALLGKPVVLLLDEPTAGLDPIERINLRNLIINLAKDRIVLYATHIISDVEHIANQIVLMKDGHIIKMDTPQRLINSLQSKITLPIGYSLSMEDVYLYYLGEDKCVN